MTGKENFGDWRRRDFLKTSAAAVLGLTFSNLPAMAGPFTREDFEHLVPADKKLSADWIKSLFARGTPDVLRGGELKYVGMPIGGIGAGQLYLGGDGRLWHWDIFNQPLKRPKPDDGHYRTPLTPGSPLEQGFAVQVKSGEQIQAKKFQLGDWSDISFRGEYPVGIVEYADATMPVSVKLEVFSPFIPLNTEDSSLPATIFEFTLKNNGSQDIEVQLCGWLENAIGLHSTTKHTGERANRINRSGGVIRLDCAATESTPGEKPFSEEADFGTMTLALLGDTDSDCGNASAQPGAAGLDTNAAQTASVPLTQKLIGSVARKVALKPGASAGVTFILAWHFPNLSLPKLGKVGRHYSTRFTSAGAVADHVAKHHSRLAAETKLWRDTWYDSTLPFWFLDRTILNTSILASSTCYRFADGRFYGWEGVGCCEGTCGHVYHYAHAIARLFPDLERVTRERVDFGLAQQPDGAIHFRGEFNKIPAVDGQAGTILRALREHQMCVDNAFLKRNWPQIKRATQWLIAKDANTDGLIESNQHNTLDTDWFGAVAWLSGLYLASLAAAAKMADEVGDGKFAAECRKIHEAGRKNLVTQLFDGDYFINRVDPKHLEAINSGTGCEIDQVFGQSWAFQVGLPRVLPEKETITALKSLWRYNFSPDVGLYREANKPGRWYAMPGEAGLLMCTFPRRDWDYAKASGKGKAEWAAGYFNECMNGFEYQVAGHMIWEGMVMEGLAVTRAVHDRYHASRRNPWNEIECGDHYARSMASYGVYLAACGFEYDGPKAHIGFAPKLTPENFKCAFTSAAGWGSFSQKAESGNIKAEIAVRWGTLKLKTIALQSDSASVAKVFVGGKNIAATLKREGKKVVLTLENTTSLTAGETIQIALTRPPKMHSKKITLLALLLGNWLVGSVIADTLENDFRQPPAATQPRCYWYWMDGQITKTGITRDLEAMKRVGIGEGYIGVISGQSGQPTTSTTKALTHEWWSYIEHAVREGTRLGVDIGLFNSPGWSQSGGPWVKPSQAMRYVTLPELRLHGPQHFTGKLPLPAGEFQELAVLAFPAPAGENESAKIIARAPKLVSFEMPSPFTARSVTVQPTKAVNVTAELLASDDGQQFRLVKKFTLDRHTLQLNVGPVPLAPVVASFPATTARFFQLKFSKACEPGEIQLSPAARVESFAEKSLQKVCQTPHPLYDFYTWPNAAEPDATGLTVQLDAVQNLSQLMAADGTLNWNVPAGDWIILRTALTPTGTKNSPAPPEATGLEVDKMNRVPLRAHFEAYVGNLIKRLTPAERKSWKHVVADSYEMGPENWTDGFAADFQKRYGYDPLPFLPVMTGRIIGSADQSDRFLWDLRRLVADRVAKDYVGGLRDLCHEHGMKMWLENYGHWGFPGEFLSYGGDCDEIGGEFWANGNFLDERDTEYLGRYELRAASSSANIYGKPITWAEAFTGGPAFVNSPRDLKARGDWAFCQGINQFVFHVNIHQPADDKLPGVNAWFGTEFNRNNTWFESSKAWIDYLRRCSVLLQTGKHAADVAYFISEDAPKMAGSQSPPLPKGFDFDFINADVIEHRLTVKDGRLTLPDGVSYRLLVLPESATMRPELLKKIRDLVQAGATIVGSPPSRSPSLENFPKCDAEVQTRARELWGTPNPKAPGERACGQGRVFWGQSLDAIFTKLAVKPDLETSAKLGFTHRHSDDADIYFVANPEAKSLTTTIGFRAGDCAPELWWPDTGRRERPAVYAAANGVVRLPLSFAPNGSVFVVFREKAAAPAEQIVAVTRNGQDIFSAAEASEFPLQLTRNAAGRIEARGGSAGDYELKFADGHTRPLKIAATPPPIEIAGSWEVSFPPGWDAPEKITFDQLADWTQRPEPGIEFFSGKATYRKTFEVSALPPPGSALVLDLGIVNDLATVRLNGRELGTLWQPPYRVDIAADVHPGANTLEVDVVNTWHNRLTGDAKLPANQRHTSLTSKFTAKSSELLPAGLLGPVRLCQTDTVEIK